MRAELKRFHSPDVSDLSKWQPKVVDDFGFLVQAMIGPVGGEGEESFSFVVCTPKWLGRKVVDKEFSWVSKTLLVKHYDFESIAAEVGALCKQAGDRPWSELGVALAQSMDWEFTNYRDRTPA